MICPKCHSNRVVKNGTQARWSGGKKYRVQIYRCNNCGKEPLGDRVKR